MNFKIKDYTEVVKNLKLFIDINMNRQVEDGTHLFNFNDTTYLLGDNGGETNVILINDKSKSIPHTAHFMDVTPKVLAYRIATYLTKGYKAINWDITEEIINKSREKYKTYDVEIVNYTMKEE